MSFPEILAALFVACIEDGAISEDDAGRHHHTVAVGVYATVHTGGIINHNTTDHCTAYRGRVGWEHATIWLQDLIHTSTYNTWLQFNGVLILAYFILLPMLASNDEHRVRTTLTAQRGARSTEGKRQQVFPA